MNARRFIRGALAYWGLVGVSVFFICAAGSCSLGLVQNARAADIEAAGAALDPLVEYRWCGPPARSESGVILRSSAVRAAFRQIHPCPSTGLRSGACPNWQINHNIPLICHGCDSLINLSWIPSILKIGPGRLPIDRWEQKVYCAERRELVPMPDPREFRLEVVPR